MNAIRLTCRSLIRERGYSFSVLLALTLGIGSSVATFAVVRSVLLRPVPVRDQARIVVLSMEDLSASDTHVGLTNGVLWDYLGRTQAIQSVAGVPATVAAAPFPAKVGNQSVQLAVTPTTGNFFQVLGTRPSVGRLLDSTDDRPGAATALVLSHAAWQRVFGGRTDVIRQTVELNGTEYWIVGVAASAFDYPKGTDAWVSWPRMVARFGVREGPEGGYWDLVARLKPGVSVTAARADFASFLTHYDAPRLGEPKTRGAVVTPLLDVIVGDLKPGLILLSCAVTLVLLIAVVNVIGMLLTRGLSRRPELAVRAAMGADHRELVSKLLLENSLLLGLGGTLGAFLGIASLPLIRFVSPGGLARFDQLRVDSSVVLFAIGLVTASILACGLMPALRAGRGNVHDALRASGRGMPDSRMMRNRELIVIGQVALTVVILAGAGLLVRTFANLSSVDLGFDARHLLFGVLEQEDAGSASYDAGVQRQRDVLSGLSDALPHEPGILSATPLYGLPFSVVGGTQSRQLWFRLPGQSTSDALSGAQVVSDGGGQTFFKTLGIRVVEGRGFTADDRAGSAPVAVVSRSFARLAWPSESPLGKQFQLMTMQGRGPMRTVVGVATDTRFVDVRRIWPTVYVPWEQSEPGPVIAIRTAQDPRNAAGSLKTALTRLDQGYGLAKTVSGAELLDIANARPRFLAQVLGALATIALLLGALGLYGMLVFSARQRRHEIGVRLALGATAGDIRALIFRYAATILVFGLSVGVALAIVATRLLRAQLFDVKAWDPVNLATTIILLCATAAVSSYLPARRASRCDPLRVLRAE